MLSYFNFYTTEVVSRYRHLLLFAFALHDTDENSNRFLCLSQILVDAYCRQAALLSVRASVRSTGIHI